MVSNLQRVAGSERRLIDEHTCDALAVHAEGFGSVDRLDILARRHGGATLAAIADGLSVPVVGLGRRAAGGGGIGRRCERLCRPMAKGNELAVRATEEGGCS